MKDTHAEDPAPPRSPQAREAVVGEELAGGPFERARAAFWSAPAAGPPAPATAPATLPPRPAVPPGGGTFGGLLRTEYRPPYERAPVPESGCPPEDLLLAAVRRAVRLGLPLPPEDLVGFGDGAPALRTAAAEAWPQTLRWHGRKRTTQALRHRLLAGAAPGAGAYLLEVADACGLRALEPGEAAELGTAGATGTDARRLRHAAWRYLAGIADGEYGLPAPDAVARDPYERLLLALAWQRRAGSSHPYAAPVRQALAGLPAVRTGGLQVVQSMLLGRLDTPGAGLSGGLSVLLGSLGDALTGTGGVARVITLVTTDHAGAGAAPASLVHRHPGEQGADGHWVLSVPVDAAAVLSQEETGEHRAALAWSAAALLSCAGVRPDVLHVRYADDGSLAMAQAARRLGAKLVFTVTADPHRVMSERYGRRQPGRPARTPAPLRDDLHRVFVADRLVARADGLVAIPGRSGGVRETVRYFPQLADGRPRRVPAAPPEGIAPYRPRPGDDAARRALLAALFSDGARPDALPAAARGLPVLLSVGRLHPVKQQDLLVDAWIAAGLHHRSALVLVGGAAQGATAAERGMRERIAARLARDPAAAGQLAMLPALPNREVRLLHRALAGLPRRCGRPALYVCPSAKEEFGLAVLEAMEAGLAAAAPSRGGAPHYLRDGVNGQLLDTSSVASLGSGLLRLFESPPARLRAMAARGRRTVGRDYSVRAMAAALAREYAELAAAGTGAAGTGAAGTGARAPGWEDDAETMHVAGIASLW